MNQTTTTTSISASTSASDSREFQKFPQQRVHPRLTERLFQETERLRNHPRYSQLSLPPMFDLNVVAAALRGLQGTGETPRCLDPWRSSELQALLTEGPRLVRYCWRLYAKSQSWAAYLKLKEGQTRPQVISLDMPETHSLLPSAALYDGYSSGCHYRDILNGELGRALLAHFLCDKKMARERAICLTLDLLTDETLLDIREGLIRQGVPLPPYDTLRKWTLRERARVTPRLRQLCAEWGLI